LPASGSRPIVIAETDDGRPKRKPLPDHLPREDVVLAIAGDTCGCCGGALHAVGESVSEMLDWVPAQLRVVRITRPKYACRSCNKVVCHSACNIDPLSRGIGVQNLNAD
jgi:transposase